MVKFVLLVKLKQLSCKHAASLCRKLTVDRCNGKPYSIRAHVPYLIRFLHVLIEMAQDCSDHFCGECLDVNQ